MVASEIRHNASVAILTDWPHTEGMTGGPQIRITVDGKLALTTAQAAVEHGYDPASSTMRAEIRRLGITPVAHLDTRTPLYNAVELRKALKERPGKGARTRTS